MLFCLLSLVIVVFYGCANSEPEAVVDPTETTDTQEPLPDSTNTEDTDTPDDTSPWSEPIYGEQKDFVISIEGMEETVPMTYTELDFAHWPGAAKVALYIDRTRYNCYVFEGEYNIVPIDSGENPLAMLHIFPRVGETAQEVFDETKNIYNGGERGSVIDEGTIELEHHTALYLTNDAGETCYFVDYNGGCVFLSLWVTGEAAEGHGARLAAMVNTVEISE